MSSEEEEGGLMEERREDSLWSRSRLGVLALILNLFFIFSSGVGGNELYLLLPLTLKLLVPLLLLRLESAGRMGLTRTHTCILVLRSVEGRSRVLRLDLGDVLGVRRLLFGMLLLRRWFVRLVLLVLRFRLSNVGVATDRNRSVEGDGDRMAEVLLLVVVRGGDRR